MIQHRIKKTSKLPKGKEQYVPKAKGKKQRAKNNIKKVRKSLLKQTDIAKKRRLPPKDSE